MRMRIISAAVVLGLGLGLVGITLARQTGAGRRDDKAELRTQVVKLRVEIELLQIEHEVDGEHLKAVMAEMRTLEAYDAGVLRRMQIDDLKKIADATGTTFSSGVADDLLKKSRETARTYIDCKRKDYAKQGAELAEKRLELADLEKRYNEAR
jgi:hypothetical protein